MPEDSWFLLPEAVVPQVVEISFGEFGWQEVLVVVQQSAI